MKNIALFDNADKPEAAKYAELSAKMLLKMGAAVFAKPDLLTHFSPETAKQIKPIQAEEFEKFADEVISFGGDGTMLSAAHLLINSNLPIMGINVGKLGFLAEYSVANLNQAILDLMEGNYRVVDRFVIETTLNGERLYALNDIVVEKRQSSRMITITTFANDHHIADYRSDGLIVTTPTGSTAYSLSCNGPVIAPSTRVLCLTPISPHSLNLRPLIIPDTNEVKLRVKSPTGEVNLVIDGQVSKVVPNDVEIIIKRSDALVKLIKPLQSSYYDLLRRKLLWAAHTTDVGPHGND
jgi:NAD+ kinase